MSDVSDACAEHSRGRPRQRSGGQTESGSSLQSDRSRSPLKRLDRVQLSEAVGLSATPFRGPYRFIPVLNGQEIFKRAKISMSSLAQENRKSLVDVSITGNQNASSEQGQNKETENMATNENQTSVDNGQFEAPKRTNSQSTLVSSNRMKSPKRLTNWVPCLGGTKLFVEGNLIEDSGEIVRTRWTTSRVISVNPSGKLLHTKSRDYHLDGDLCTELCKPSMPSFLKIAFRRGFPAEWDEYLSEWKSYLLSKSNIDQASELSVGSSFSGVKNFTQETVSASAKSLASDTSGKVCESKVMMPRVEDTMTCSSSSNVALNETEKERKSRQRREYYQKRKKQRLESQSVEEREKEKKAATVETKNGPKRKVGRPRKEERNAEAHSEVKEIRKGRGRPRLPEAEKRRRAELKESIRKGAKSKQREGKMGETEICKENLSNDDERILMVEKNSLTVDKRDSTNEKRKTSLPGERRSRNCSKKQNSEIKTANEPSSQESDDEMLAKKKRSRSKSLRKDQNLKATEGTVESLTADGCPKEKSDNEASTSATSRQTRKKMHFDKAVVPQSDDPPGASKFPTAQKRSKSMSSREDRRLQAAQGCSNSLKAVISTDDLHKKSRRGRKKLIREKADDPATTVLKPATSQPVKKPTIIQPGLMPNPKTASDYRHNTQVLKEINRDHEDDIFVDKNSKPKPATKQKTGNDEADFIHNELFDSESETDFSVRSARTPIANYFESTTQSESGSPTKLRSEIVETEENYHEQVFLNRKLKESRKRVRKKLADKIEPKPTTSKGKDVLRGLEKIKEIRELPTADHDDDSTADENEANDVSSYSNYLRSYINNESLVVPPGLIQLAINGAKKHKKYL